MATSVDPVEPAADVALALVLAFAAAVDEESESSCIGAGPSTALASGRGDLFVLVVPFDDAADEDAAAAAVAAEEASSAARGECGCAGDDGRFLLSAASPDESICIAAPAVG